MSSYSVCTKCGEIDAYEWRERCDGCGVSIRTDPIPFIAHVASASVKENQRHYCEDCGRKAVAAMPLLKCVRCGHGPNQHCSACLMPECHCNEFVAPQRGG